MARRSGGRAAAGCDKFSGVSNLLGGSGGKSAAQGFAGGVTQGTVRGGVTRISRR